MTITAIKRKKGDLYTVETDEGSADVDIRTLEQAADVAQGFSVTPERLAELAYQSECRRARSKSLKLVAVREMCCAGLRRKLGDAGFSREACEYVIAEMETLGFVSDSRYAEMYAEELYRVKKYAPRRVSHELINKGISRELAEETAHRLAPDTAETLSLLLEGRLGDELDTDSGRRRCAMTLNRYGYDPADIHAAIRRREGQE